MRRHALLAASLVLLIAACDKITAPPSPQSATSPATATATVPAPARTVPAAMATPPLPQIPGLVFGQPIAPASGWRAHADPLSDECRTYASPAFPDAYAIVIDGRLERVTLARASGFRLPSGIAPGSPEAAVRKVYPDFVAEPHKYADAPAKYLTQPDLGPAETGIRFEIGQDGMVELIHIGLPSALSLVEGCA